MEIIVFGTVPSLYTKVHVSVIIYPLYVVDTFKISEHFTKLESALKLQVIYTNFHMHKEF